MYSNGWPADEQGIKNQDRCRRGGGEIAVNLRQLYHFMVGRLSEANAKKDPQMIREVIKLMEELNQGWKVITG